MWRPASSCHMSVAVLASPQPEDKAFRRIACHDTYSANLQDSTLVS